MYSDYQRRERERGGGEGGRGEGGAGVLSALHTFLSILFNLYLSSYPRKYKISYKQK